MSSLAPKQITHSFLVLESTCICGHENKPLVLLHMKFKTRIPRFRSYTLPLLQDVGDLDAAEPGVMASSCICFYLHVLHNHTHSHIYIYIHIHCAYVRISIWYKIWITSRSPDHLGFSPAHTVLGQHRDQVPQEKLPEDAPEQTPAPRKGTKHHQHRHQLFFFKSLRGNCESEARSGTLCGGPSNFIPFVVWQVTTSLVGSRWGQATWRAGQR